jgi:hypothetical protein
MRYFKDQADGFYVVESGFVTDEDGWVEITRQEFEAANPASVQNPAAVAQAEIERLEQEQIKRTARMEREERLKEAEAYALATLGLNPEQLYAAASQPNAPVSFRTYKAMKNIDNSIVALRAQLS